MRARTDPSRIPEQQSNRILGHGIRVMPPLRRLGLLVLVATFAFAQPSSAVPGPESNPSDFEIFVEELIGGGETVIYSNTRFAAADGWDFGDRGAYSCAWAEFFRDGSELFEVHYELIKDYPDPVAINDRDGVEAPDPEIAPLCGDGIGPGASITHDGSDHFPHGTDIVFFQGDVEIARVDYSDDPCAKGYWTPGDEAGEAWLWWDEDFPTDKVEHGDGLCGGGPGEPIAVVRAFAQGMAGGIEVCSTDAMSGDRCSNAPPATVEHLTEVTLRLKGHLRAVGRVESPGSVACAADRLVVLQRRASGAWKKAGEDSTNDEGRYRVQVRAKEGRYRARAGEETLANGDLCTAATSPRRVYRA